MKFTIKVFLTLMFIIVLTAIGITLAFIDKNKKRPLTEVAMTNFRGSVVTGKKK